MPEPGIRLFFDLGADLEPNGPDYTREAFGGIIPSVGDLIVDPGVTDGEDRRRPENRTVMEVVARYILPDDEFPKIGLAVKTRPGKEHEINVLGD